VPLLLIGILPFIFSSGTSLKALIFFLFFSYFFSSLSGASWNSWMKDLVPGKMLGSYFSKRSRLLQILNVTLSLLVAIVIDYVKIHHPQYELAGYICMFVIGGSVGMLGVYLLSRAPEPTTCMGNENIFTQFRKPLKDKNFKSLLLFNSVYSFAVNLALPFFVVFMMKTIGLPLSYIIALGLLAKFSSILSIRLWGIYSDRYSNKTIILVCAPAFISCILAWSFMGMGSSLVISVMLLAIIHIVSGASKAGVDLAINNIAIKLAPKEEAISYITARNIITGLFAGLAPIIGGALGDFFATHQLSWSIQWPVPNSASSQHFFQLKNWNFYFVIAAVLAALSLRLLKNVKEEGEVHRQHVYIVMRKSLRTGIRKNFKAKAIRYRIANTVRIQVLSYLIKSK
jgi:MFS family permease